MKEVLHSLLLALLLLQYYTKENNDYNFCVVLWNNQIKPVLLWRRKIELDDAISH